ncbi:hypothetical protein OVA11_19420 [Caulobacter sp. SL161]|uniref:hypothetical protein n=1 Tax=Caulobacter sp. SL161 TaxID=2995156 RepID=UPI0022765863|nr:hypothetical protein [Caulobacter sp. SL161]MCY1649148.1 hypothetical protein [Caulobacter sp. SL161]
MSTTKVTITTITADFGGELNAGSGAAFAEELVSVLGARISDVSTVGRPKPANSDWTTGAHSERAPPRDDQGVGPKAMLTMRLTDEAKARFSDICYQHRGETVSDVLVKLMDAYEFGRR